jgi:thiosulfate/3-mercaptopyruvate sulfurtransferase
MPLVGVDALAACLSGDRPIFFGDSAFDRNRLRVVDVRWYLGRPGDGRRAYEAGHIPGAIFLDIDGDLADPPGAGRHPLPDPVAFRRRLEAAGIGSEDLVVPYDDVGGWIAARLWWMLDDLGHRAVALLDGGFPAWVTAGYRVATDVPALPPARLELADAWHRVIDRDELRARLGSVVVVDGRAAERYRGETEPIDAVAGHIPTAVNAPVLGNTTPDGHFRSAAELAARFTAIGADGADARTVITACGSGVAACQNALAMRIAGFPDPILYAGSYSDWTRAGLPVVTGSEPGSANVVDWTASAGTAASAASAASAGTASSAASAASAGTPLPGSGQSARR